MSSNNTDPAPDVVAEGSSYFLHVTAAGEEQRFSKEPAHLHWQTHLVKIIEVEDNTVTEQTTLILRGPPHGMGWRHVHGHTYRRTRFLVVGTTNQQQTERENESQSSTSLVTTGQKLEPV